MVKADWSGCNACGKCCRNINNIKIIAPEYSFMVMDDGCCKFFDRSTNLCKIYTERPYFCKGKEVKDLYFSHLTDEEFERLSIEACNQIKRDIPD